MNEQGLEQGMVNFDSDKGREVLDSVMDIAEVTDVTKEAWERIKTNVLRLGAIPEEKLGQILIDSVEEFIREASNPSGNVTIVGEGVLDAKKAIDNPKYTLEQDFKVIALKLNIRISIWEGNTAHIAMRGIADYMISKLRE